MRPAPFTEEIASTYLDLLAGRQTREQAGTWARQWMDLPNPPFAEERLLHAMDCLAGADKRLADGTYLFSDDDFRAWLFILQAR